MCLKIFSNYVAWKYFIHCQSKPISITLHFLYQQCLYDSYNTCSQWEKIKKKSIYLLFTAEKRGTQCQHVKEVTSWHLIVSTLSPLITRCLKGSTKAGRSTSIQHTLVMISNNQPFNSSTINKLINLHLDSLLALTALYWSS